MAELGGIQILGVRRKRKRRGSGGGITISAPVLTWVIDTADLTPAFTFDFTDPAVSDVVTLRRSTSAIFASYEDASVTITDLAPPTFSGDFNYPGTDWAYGTWYVKCFVTRGTSVSDDSNTETFTLVSPASFRIINGGDFRTINGGDSRIVA